MNHTAEPDRMRGQVSADGSHCGTVRGAARDTPFGCGAEFDAPGMGMDEPIDECAEISPYGQMNFGHTLIGPGNHATAGG
ncbi:hypothetical protein [Streptomyces sp. NPDC048496]|uniref:hypothetical protein n=1 Tax=Streptomyces sp. NPDC048496 TaxID=3365558 RepID=UPI003717AECF